jgi:pimeloyl-ACP methyl ester carboxylesterase
MKPLTRIAGAALFGATLCTLCLADDLPPRRTVDIFGQHIEYYDVGTGPTLVLLHGLATSARVDWGACITRLSTHYRVIAPDQIGFGASAKPMINYGVQTWVDFLGEFLRVEHVSDFTLAGESLGGWVAANYTIEALGGAPPAGESFILPKPSRLVLVDAGGHKALAATITSGNPPALSLAGSKGLLSAIYFDPARGSDDAVRAQMALSLSKGDGWTIYSLSSNKGLVNECVDGRLAAITVPTLVIWGEEDHLVPLADGRDYAAQIPGAKLVVVPESGHAPAIEKPDVVCSALEQFVGVGAH